MGAFAAAFPPAVLVTRPPGAARLSLRLIERLGLVAMRGGPAGSRCDREARHAVSQAPLPPAPASPSRSQHGVPSDKIADHVARDRWLAPNGFVRSSFWLVEISPALVR